jgi:hypothetical protein
MPEWCGERDHPAAGLGRPMIGSPWRILTYDVEHFPFASIARQMLGVSDLSGLPAVETPGSPRSDKDSEYWDIVE